MLYYNFKNFEEFKNIFRIEKTGDDTTIRKNKILLAHLKNPNLFKYCLEIKDYNLLKVKDMAALQNAVFEAVRKSGQNDDSLPNKIELIDKEYWSVQYKTDEMRGVCKDGDKCSIRYVNTVQGKTFKMKASKFMRSIILETQIGKILSPSVINWICGDVFYKQWHTFTYGCTSGMQLHVDDNFKEIYNGEKCLGNFDSCMTDKNRYKFYKEAVKAKATYLTDKNGCIVARAILFTDVTDQNGRKWRLLERQYATDKDDILKYMLINKLIQEKLIDGYKIVGASCRDANAFVSIDGESLFDMKFEIECNLGMEDLLSYQDSFKWYNYEMKKAYNYQQDEDLYELDTTNLNLYGDNEYDEDEEDEEDEEWDEYHQRYCQETRICYRHGMEICVDANDLDDFEYIESRREYYHKDDTILCNYCEDCILEEDSLYSDITDNYYCCELCRKDAEEEYKEKYWYYSDYDDAWYKNSEDIMEIEVCDKQTGENKTITISVATFDRMIEHGQISQLDIIPSCLADNPLNESLQNMKCHEYTTVKKAI